MFILTAYGNHETNKSAHQACVDLAGLCANDPDLFLEIPNGLGAPRVTSWKKENIDALKSLMDDAGYECVLVEN